MIFTILCCESKGLWHNPINLAIKFVEKVDFSHYAILADGYVYEAVSPQSRSIPFSQWRDKYDIVRTYTLNVSEPGSSNLLSRIQDELGKPYAYSQILMILMTNMFKLKGTLEINGKKALICSEFVARPLAEVLGYKFSVTPDNVGMDELENVLKTQLP